MRIIIDALVTLFIILSSFIPSCSWYRERLVDKTKLHGQDYRLFQQTPAWELAKAVQDRNASKIREIVRSSPELINYQDSVYGNTLLMLTIDNMNFKSFKILLEEGADVNIYDTFSGASAIISASGYNSVRYAELLLSHGADVNDVENSHRTNGKTSSFTPLIEACYYGNYSMVKYLISKGADINYLTEGGYSALTHSALGEEYDIVYYLLENGADYHRPLFYRTDYSIPTELRDSADKGKPVYLKDFLLEQKSYNTNKKKLNKVLNYLYEQGVE